MACHLPFRGLHQNADTIAETKRFFPFHSHRVSSVVSSDSGASEKLQLVGLCGRKLT